jgi:hypothetical protein
VVRREVNAMEDRVGMKRGRTSNVEEDVEIMKLIPYISFAKNKESKYTKIVVSYWHMKVLLACVIKSKGIQENTFLQWIDQLDSKYRL